MLGKTFILGLVLAAGAGGIVYYGSSAMEVGDLSGIEGAHPHGKARAESNGRISPRLPTIRKAVIKDGREKLSTRNGLAGDVTQEETTQKQTTQKQTRWLDQYLNKGGADRQAEIAVDVEMFEPQNTHSPESHSSEATNRFTVEELEIIEDIEPEAAEVMPPASEERIDPRYFKIVDGKLVEIGPKEATTKETLDDVALDDVMGADDVAQMEEAVRTAAIVDTPVIDVPVVEDTPVVKDKPSFRFTRDINTMAEDASPLISTVMREAAEIKRSELRDQAYFEITEYALSEGRFESARLAHDMIEQEELSYTAKSRIAVAYAQKGQPTKAFKTIAEVDEAELRDFMRLQVIEALIAPSKLPAEWQEK